VEIGDEPVRDTIRRPLHPRTTLNDTRTDSETAPHTKNRTSPAEDVLDELNDTPLTIGSSTFAPTEGLEGLLLELADNFRHYVQTTPWWKVWWDAKRDRQPWLADRFGQG